MPKPIKLVNRGGFGLLDRTSSNGQNVNVPTVDRAAAFKDNIQCDGEVVRIDSLTPDPMNARLHPDRNMDAIMDSLCLYGQRLPLVVRQQNRVVAAGNGRLEAARRLGWTVIAVSIRPMTDAEFHGFALADNRTAELATWDAETVAKVDQLLETFGTNPRPGWSMAELEALRSLAVPVESPEDFPEVGEDLEVEHNCPKCGYKWSGGKTTVKGAESEANGYAERPARQKRAQPAAASQVEAVEGSAAEFDFNLFGS